MDYTMWSKFIKKKKNVSLGFRLGMDSTEGVWADRITPQDPFPS